MYKSLTDKLLFDYYMIDCNRKDSIFSTYPFYIDKSTLQQMIYASEILNGLVQRVIKGINENFSDFKSNIPNFHYMENIMNLNIPLPQLFWIRFDAFIREEGGIFFSEFNYDKPCAQREMLVGEYLCAENNVNDDFKQNFVTSFKQVVKRFFKDRDSFNVVVLIDPCHSEEAHLSYLYKTMLEDSNFKFTAVGPKNLKVIGKEVFAFGTEKVDVILRQFPTEHLEEVRDIEEILSLYNEGKILILNDPRVIIGQSKNLFAYFWKLVEGGDIRLTKKEREVIIKTLPYTCTFNESIKDEILKNKDKYVLKPVYGRYSEDVFIGVLHEEEEWKEVVEYIRENPKEFIAQQFCAIHKEAVTTSEHNRALPKEAFGNFGVYIIEEKVRGLCTRWNETYLTSDDSTWITPIGVSEKYIDVFKMNLNNRKSLWDKITDRSLMEYDFTGRYFRDKEYVGLDPIILDREKFKELKKACEDLCNIFKKSQNLVLENIDIFSPILGTEALKKIAATKHTNEFLFLGRLDWCLNDRGQWKLLEINSETPAGIVESIGLSRIIKEELNIQYENPNENMVSIIREEFLKILKDYEKINPIINIGILSSTYYEDWYNTKMLYRIIKDSKYKVHMGNIYDLTVKEDKIHIYGETLDAVFRYYPLDWFVKEDKEDVLKAFEKNTLSINPPHTIISQSKAFLALIFELKEQGFFSTEEGAIIDKYVTRTTFDVEKLGIEDICIKPLLDREGNGVLLGYEVFEEPEQDFIFQEREHIKPLDYTIYSTVSKENKLLYPIIGTYIAGNNFCGIYTRLGSIVTTSSCVYAPLFIGD